MKYCYEDKKFTSGTLAVIDQANQIIDEYANMGMTLTLRQLYYQFVSRAWIANKQTEYKRLGGIISNGRLAGHIDWAAIEDRTRKPVLWRHIENAKAGVDSIQGCVDKDKWNNQAVAVEVWIEKDALTGVIERPCMKYDVPYFACKGYNSSSAAYRAGQRIARRDKPTVIFHLGDHDPSGMDMTHDNQKRMDMFAPGKAIFERIALNMDQISTFNPPPNPTKLTDSRAKEYIAEFGHTCWELDALDPMDMRSLIEKEISRHIDQDKWDDVVSLERAENAQLYALSDYWDEVEELLLEKRSEL